MGLVGNGRSYVILQCKILPNTVEVNGSGREFYVLCSALRGMGTNQYVQWQMSQ